MNLLITGWTKAATSDGGSPTFRWDNDLDVERADFTTEDANNTANYSIDPSIYIAFSVIATHEDDSTTNIFAVQNGVADGHPLSYVGNPPNEGAYSWSSLMPTTGDEYVEIRGTADLTLTDLEPVTQLYFHGRLVVGGLTRFLDWTAVFDESVTLEPATWTFRYPIKYIEWEEGEDLYVSVDYHLDPDSPPFFTDSDDADMEYVLSAPYDMEYVLAASAVARRMRTLDQFATSRL